MIDKGVWDRTFKDEQGKMLLAPFAMMAGMFDEAQDSRELQVEEMKEKVQDELGSMCLTFGSSGCPGAVSTFRSTVAVG